MSPYLRYFVPIDRTGAFDVQGLRQHAQTYARRNLVASLVVVLSAMDFGQALVFLSFPFVVMTYAAIIAIIHNGIDKK